MAYCNVDNEFWADTIDWSADERDLAIYLLTCEYRNQEGLFRIRIGQIEIDRCWPIERVQSALTALTARGWLIHDGSWMLLCNSLRWSPPAGIKQVKGAARRVKNAPVDAPIWASFYDAAVRFAPDFAREIPAPTPTEKTTADRVSAVEEGASFSTQLYSTHSHLTSPPRAQPDATHLTAVASPPTGSAVVVTTEIENALVNAGFDRLVIEQSEGAIGQVLREFIPPPDVDWYRLGQIVREARENQTCLATRPSSAIKWVAKGMAGYPRIGQGSHGSPPTITAEKAARFAKYDEATIISRPKEAHGV
jgi:hypothetical protein